MDDYSVDEHSSDSDTEDLCNSNCRQSNAIHDQIEWHRPTLITGNPGTGKSRTILACVSELLKQDVNIMIAAPTGFLASGYRSQTHDEVSCERFLNSSVLV